MTQPAAPKNFAEAQTALAAALPGYKRRPQQEKLAEAIEATFASASAVADEEMPEEPLQLLAQAGTGTGKSLGAMIPAILSGNRTIVATATIALMNQYTESDLPLLETHLGVPFTWAPLKGIRNFVCLSRLDQQVEGANENIDALVKELDLETTDDNGLPVHTGDKDDITTPLDSMEWMEVSTSSDECIGKKCAFAEKCFSMRHKAEAREAQIVVTNTAMLMTDVKLTREIRESSENSQEIHAVLGDYDQLVLDEAHELETIATEHLGFDIKKGGLLDYFNKAVTFVNVHGGAEEKAQELEDKALRILDTLGVILDEKRTGEDGKKEDKLTIDTAFVAEQEEIVTRLITVIRRMHDKVVGMKLERGSKANQGDQKQRLIAMGKNFLKHCEEIFAAADDEMVRWAEFYEARKGHSTELRWVIKGRPIDVGPALRAELWSKVPAVLMSATLSTGTGPSKFAYMQRALGLTDSETLDVGSPFDYPNQARLFIPGANVPIPSGRTYGEWATWAPEATLELVRASKGGAMLLFTSRKAMKNTYDAIADRLNNSGYTTLLQGDGMSNKALAEEFRDDEDSVLFGLRSFMTGVNFSGKTNRLVVIDKLPFPVPTEPIFAARSLAVERRGGNSFSDLSVPMMTLILEQAFGRLIRSVEDWGTVAILDPRLTTKGYGKNIVRALPPCPAETDMNNIRVFYDAWLGAPAVA